MSDDLNAAIRTLLLPVKPGIGSAYDQRASEILIAIGVEEAQADWVRLEASAWRKSTTPSVEFSRFVQELIYTPDRTPVTFMMEPEALGNRAAYTHILTQFSSRYFEIHKRIMAEERVGHEEAMRVLSYAHTMMLMATAGGMTASRIYSILLADGITISKSWSTPRFILDLCGIRQDVSAADIEKIYDEDKDTEPDLLGDLTLEEAVGHVAASCQTFGYDGDLHGQLRTLLIDHRHTPYLVMLHFQTSLIQIYNHRLTNGYEFSPRGEGVLWLTDRYNQAGLNVGLSPFLNNAKSVDTLNAGWASSKKKRERHAARALVDMLAELDRLSDPSRAAAGLYLRGILHRIIRISSEAGGGLVDPLPPMTLEMAGKLMAGVANGNTSTKGVIEQRLSDCIALHGAGDLNAWRRRGFGDSVFTTNTASKKFGDAELKHLTDPIIVAIEAHGGRLTEKYVQDHLFTMSNVLPLRAEELEDRAPLTDWRIRLQFHAHALDDGMTTAVEICGTKVEIEYRTYADLALIKIDDVLVETLNEHLTAHLNAIHIHPEVRRKLIALLS
ncbi:hypothetical protein [uncultured Sulfitobacter sp.]|uniref:hypothetical protein n=1 Tax=uncultured Sulfitobacter sp. TaxID=191468 RepID=UPI0030DD48DB